MSINKYYFIPILLFVVYIVSEINGISQIVIFEGCTIKNIQCLEYSKLF